MQQSTRTVNYSYLGKQFKGTDRFLEAIRRVVQRGDFTLGVEVAAVEERVAALCGTRFAIGVNSGTDALFLAFKALGIGEGDEVITAPNSFFATAGAIAQAGARPVFADVLPDYSIDPDAVEACVTERTRAIVPVHLCGQLADMERILAVAARHGLEVVEDAAQALGARWDGRAAGAWGVAGAFSFHPLKNINGWGDGGMITTNSAPLNEKLRLLRNHGLQNRDECVVFGYNSRLDTIQAAIILELIGEIEDIADTRTGFARLYDEQLGALAGDIIVPPRDARMRHMYHTYVVRARERDRLLDHLIGRGVEAKVHYPKPLHLQKAVESLGYAEGRFPVCESLAKEIISLPVHQHLDEADVHYVCSCVREFYGR